MDASVLAGEVSGDALPAGGLEASPLSMVQ
jgi:hypothetical protein